MATSSRHREQDAITGGSVVVADRGIHDVSFLADSLRLVSAYNHAKHRVVAIHGAWGSVFVADNLAKQTDHSSPGIH